VDVVLEQELIKKANASNKVYIYGAGMVGGLVLKRLNANGISPEKISFVVSEARQNQMYMEYPVLDIHYIDKLEDFIIIVSTMKKNQQQIIKTLHSVGIKDFYVVDSDLYKDMEQRYVDDYLKKHKLEDKERDVLYMSSDNNNSSGAFLCLVDLNRELNDRGISTLVILPSYGNGEELLMENNIDYTYVLSDHWLVDIGEKKNADTDTNARAVDKLECFIYDYNIRLVHNNTTYNYVGAEAAKRTGIPYVWHIREFIREQGFWFCDEEKAYNLINASEVIIPVSNYVGSCYTGFDKEKIEVIYDGIDVKKYLSAHQIFKSKTVKILMPGNLIPLKGQKQLVEAAVLLKKTDIDFEISFVGSGDAEYIAELKELVGKNDLSKQVLFFDRSNELEKWYQKSDIVVVCSKSEAFGRVTVEAQLAGCLVIGAKCGATRELIEDYSTGLFYELDNADDLAEKIKWSVYHQTEVGGIINLARDSAEQKFTKEKNAESIIEIYKKVLKMDADNS
jgi:hypothetical protein